MGDDVNRALEAAMEAAVASAWDRPDDEMVRDARDHVLAAAIAAFLRALPPGWHMDKSRDELAAAVERAAKEDA